MPTRSRLAAAALGATAVATIPSAVFASSYIVRPGDTASDIAVRHGTTVAALLDANRMAAPELIRVGQMLQIPDASLDPAGATRAARTTPRRIASAKRRGRFRDRPPFRRRPHSACAHQRHRRQRPDRRGRRARGPRPADPDECARELRCGRCRRRRSAAAWRGVGGVAVEPGPRLGHRRGWGHADRALHRRVGVATHRGPTSRHLAGPGQRHRRVPCCFAIS